MLYRVHGEPEAAPPILLEAFDGKTRGVVGYMFPDLAVVPDAHLPVGQETVDGLKLLGDAMGVDASNEEGIIPAAYTYFGQFIDHDITKTLFDASLTPDPISTDFQPIAPADISRLIFNDRSLAFDLDSVYGGLASDAINQDGTMRLSEVSVASFGSIATDDRLHDLPRKPMIVNPTPAQQESDRQAQIGDPRNDENLIVAQMHVAFLRAHNILIRRGLSAEEARRALRRRYQWAVLHDFLRRICENTIVDDILANGPRFWTPQTEAQVFMPLEYSTAAYRFGHSMIRGSYTHNITFDPADFRFFFTFTALSGDLAPTPGANFQFATLPDNWVIDWSRFFGTSAIPGSQNPARRIDVHLTPELGNLRDFQGRPVGTFMGRLATRNLLRGYLLNLPTGQAVARRLGVRTLEEESLLDAVAPEFHGVLRSHGFASRTPLWFYILAEAGDKAGPNGNHLGPVGSRIVAETIWNAIKFSKDSVLVTRPSDTDLATGEFTLKGIVRMGLDSALPPLTD